VIPKQVIKGISDFGGYYKEMYLCHYKEKNLQDKWLEALNFFFGHIFPGGRRDSLSLEYEEYAMKTVKNHTVTGELNNEVIENIISDLKKRTQKNYKFPKRDRDMVKETLKFLLKIPNHNIVNYSIEKIKKGEISGLFEKIKDIVGIGSKRATLFLRDVVDVFGLEENYIKNSTKDNAYIYLQPIDVWVHDVAKHLGIVQSKNPSWEKDAPKIVKKCKDCGVSPIDFNEGAWIIGKYFAEIIGLEKALEHPAEFREIMDLYKRVKLNEDYS
jgi:hypothetical protein